MVPRTLRMSFGVDPSDGPEEAMYSTPLMLRWIARCTSDWLRSGIDARSRPAAAFILALRPRTADVWSVAVLAPPGIRYPPRRHLAAAYGKVLCSRLAGPRC